MQKYSIITFIVCFFYSTSAVKAETQAVTALSDGIAAFICDEIDNKNDVPLIFVNEGDNWSLSDTPQLSVSKIENGFKFKSSGDEEGFGFLKKISRTQWNFEYLDQKGFYETSCIPQDYFVDLLIEHISPKIIENGNSLVTKLEITKKAMLQLENSNEDLAVNESALELQIAKLLLAKSKLEEKNQETINEKKAIELLLISARNEIDEKEENARLSAAKREALEGLIVKLENEGKLQLVEINSLIKVLSKAEQTRLDELAVTELAKRYLAEAAAAELLREKLKNTNTELTAMTLALEAERKEAEDTLTKLAAANAIGKSLKIDLNRSFTEVERQAALIAQANILLNQEKTFSSSAQRKLTLLNTQTSQLRDQLNQLQGLLDESKEADSKAQIQLKMLGTNLNLALARVASEQRKVAAKQRTNATLTEEIESLKTELHNK